MFEITQLLLPHLDVDSMAAWLQTCKEARLAFHPVPIRRKDCFNRGLAERIGQTFEPEWTPNRWTFRINGYEPKPLRDSAPVVISYLVAQCPWIEAKLDNSICQHCRQCTRCNSQQLSAVAILRFWDLGNGKFRSAVEGLSTSLFMSCSFAKLQVDFEGWK